VAVTDILMRVELHDEEQATTAMRAGWPWVKEQLRQGRELVAEFRLLDDDITERQRGYLHGVVLTEIAHGLVIDGRRSSMKTWKEHLRREFLPDKRVTFVNPITGRKSCRRVRQSTEDLGVRRMVDYIDKCCAFAAEYGLEISEPLPPELRGTRARAQAIENGNVNAETGEITEVAA
jgi:hypothetical protein